MSRRAEIMGGLDEILGSAQFDQSEMVGAGVVLNPYGAPPLRGSFVGSVPVGSQRYSKGRELPLPLSSSGTLAANSSGNVVQAQPQTLFRPERWIISDPTPSFTVSDFRIGKNSIFLYPGVVPTAAFGPTAFGARLKMDTAQVSMIIAAVVNNITGTATQFTSVVMGASVE
jgi:hypothetical protein